MSQENGEEFVRYAVPPLRDRPRRTLLERLTLAAPGMARRVRVGLLRLRPASRIRRALVRKVLTDLYESWNRGDWDAALSMAHPEFERISIGPPGHLADMEDHSRGYEGWRRFMGQWLEAWEAFRLDPQEVIDFGDRVLVLVQRTGRGRGSGVELNQLCADLFTLDGGWAVRYDDYWARDDALQAAGLSE